MTEPGAPDERPSDLAGGARALVALAGGVSIAAVLFMALSRLAFPFDIEWLEGAHVDAVERILQGQPLYAAPSLAFIPFGYTPLYFHVSALVGLVAGPTHLALRLVSFASTLGCFGLIWLHVWRETRSGVAALAAAGLFAATFELTGGWFDLARVDMLFVLLVVATLHLLRHHHSVPGWASAALLLTLAWLTKQTALIIAPWFVLGAMLWDWRRGLLFGALSAAGIAGSMIALERWSGGWASFYIFDVQGQHWRQLLIPSRLLTFWYSDLIGPLGIALVFSVLPFATNESPARRGPLRLMLFAVLGLIFAAWLSRAEEGGHRNNLLPAAAGIALLFGLGHHRVIELAQAVKPSMRPRLEGMIGVAALLQFAALTYNPAVHIPGPQERADGARLLAHLRETPGAVYVAGHGHLATRLGKPMTAHIEAIRGALRATRPGVAESLQAEVDAALAQRRYSQIIATAGLGDFEDQIRATYADQAPHRGDDAVFWTLAGRDRRAEHLWLPR